MTYINIEIGGGYWAWFSLKDNKCKMLNSSDKMSFTLFNSKYLRTNNPFNFLNKKHANIFSFVKKEMNIQ
ncbi:MAG: hypothetical protein ACTJGM_09345 [Fusobacterium sp.]